MLKKIAMAFAVLVMATSACLADSLMDRIAVHVSTGLYEPQDKQGGGFRFGGGAFAGGGGGEREVEIDNGFRVAAGIQYGFREGKKAVWTLELEGSWFEEGIGAESVFQDPDASTIQPVPDPQSPTPNDPHLFFPIGATGDEIQGVRDMGTLTLVPVASHVLWHFGHRSGRASSYLGAGPAYVFTDWEPSEEYRDFVGYDDGRISDGPALSFKGGIQVFLDDRWAFDFNATYLLAREQFKWNGVSATFGEQAFDIDDDDIPDLFGQPADFRRVDPGNLRIDGLALSVGMRYAFPRIQKGGAGGSE